MRFAGALVTEPEAIDPLLRGFAGPAPRPRAVLRPASAEDVVAGLAWAGSAGMRVAARGQGHCTGPQATAPDGLVVDLRTLSRVHEVERGSVWVDGGATWADVVDATLAHGLVPPTLPGFLGLSVGGTLAVGGFGAEAFRRGAQVDQVVELEVATALGRVRCAPDREPALFDAVRAGLGQVGVVTGARLALEAAPPEVRWYSLVYPDLPTLLADLFALVDGDRFHHVSALAAPGPAGWTFEASLVRYRFDPRPLDDAALLRGLSPAEVRPAVDLPFAAFTRRTDPLIAAWRADGRWAVPHPWLDLLVPEAETERVVGGALAELTPEDLGGGLVLLTPLRTDRLRAPLLRVPRGPRAMLFDLLRNAVPAEAAPRLIAANGALYRSAAARGATLYPIGTVPLTPADWRTHFGPAFPALAAAKRRYDPRNVLGPGPGLDLESP